MHAANTACIAVVLFATIGFGLPDISSGPILGAIFVLCLDMGAVILVLCPDKRISLGIIALGFVLCYYRFEPPARYMGYITLPVWALIFWGHFGDKKWWLFPMPLLISIVFSLYGWRKWDISVSGTLVFYGILLFPVLCTYSIRNTHWSLRFLGVLVATWVFLYILIVFKPLKYLKPYIGT